MRGWSVSLSSFGFVLKLKLELGLGLGQRWRLKEVNAGRQTGWVEWLKVVDDLKGDVTSGHSVLELCFFAMDIMGLVCG